MLKIQYFKWRAEQLNLYIWHMEFSAQQIAELLQGKIEGDEHVCVNRLAKIEEGETGALSFLSNPKYAKFHL